MLIYCYYSFKNNHSYIYIYISFIIKLDNYILKRRKCVEYLLFHIPVLESRQLTAQDHNLSTDPWSLQVTSRLHLNKKIIHQT